MRCKCLTDVATEEITARYKQGSPGYGATVYKDAITASESVKDASKNFHNRYHIQYNRLLCLFLYKIEAPKPIYTGGDSLQLPLSVQTPTPEIWKFKVQGQKYQL